MDSRRDCIAQVHGSISQMEDVAQQDAALVEEAVAEAASLLDQAARLAAAVRLFKRGTLAGAAPAAR